MEKVTITQIKSGIDRSERQKRNLQALGLGKVDATVTVDKTPQIEGMIRKIQHLVKVEKA